MANNYKYCLFFLRLKKGYYRIIFPFKNCLISRNGPDDELKKTVRNTSFLKYMVLFC